MELETTDEISDFTSGGHSEEYKIECKFLEWVNLCNIFPDRSDHPLV